MRQSVRRWLAGAGTAATIGAAILGQGAGAAAAPVARSADAPAASGATYRPTKHVIYYGETGGVVRRLQQRLRYLHYYPGTADGTFGLDTLEAVWAFKEVQGLKTSHGADNVGHGMQRALVSPRLPKVLKADGGSNLRVEVNQSIQVLVLYHHGKVELISHVSTGGGYSYCDPGGSCGNIASTPDGNYRALVFWPGWVKVPLGEMWNPAFFIGRAYAIHGDTDVPLYPASHGCVRIPMDIAAFFHKRINYGSRHGTPIYIRGSV